MMRHFPTGFAPWEKRDHGMQRPIISEQGQALVMWIGVALSCTFVAIRTHAQYRNSRRLFINDYCIFFALVCHITTAIVYQIAIPPMYDVISVSAGLKPMGPTFMQQGAFFLKLQYAADILLWTTLWSVKFSLLFFFWRLFDSVHSPMKLFWWIMCGITASTWVTSVILQEFACDPIGDFFIPGKCGSERDIFFSNLVFHFSVCSDISGDVCVMLIPFPLLYKLKIDNRKRWILIGLFSLPIIPVLFACLRLVKSNNPDGDVDPIKFQLYSMLENTAAIVTSCLPAFRLFVINAQSSSSQGGSRSSRRFSWVFTSSFRSGSYSQNRRHKAIPLETLLETYQENNISSHETALTRHHSHKESDGDSLQLAPSLGNRAWCSHEFNLT